MNGNVNEYFLIFLGGSLLKVTRFRKKRDPSVVSVFWWHGSVDGWPVLGVKAYTPDKRSRQKPVEENATAPPRSCPRCVIVDSRFDPIRIGSVRVGRSPYKKPQ